MLRFLPLAFICGAHGFALFAPYLAVFLGLTHFLRRNPKSRPELKLVPIEPSRLRRIDNPIQIHD